MCEPTDEIINENESRSCINQRIITLYVITTGSTNGSLLETKCHSIDSSHFNFHCDSTLPRKIIFFDEAGAKVFIEILSERPAIYKEFIYCTCTTHEYKKYSELENLEIGSDKGEVFIQKNWMMKLKT